MINSPKLTLSMIIKNEEKFLEGCLDSVKDIVDEIIIVDTGSSDKSLEIAAKYNAKIYHFDWIDDFSAARNYALKKSTGEWILYLDADERLNRKSLSLVREVIKSNKKNGIYCNVISKSEVAGNTNKMKYIRLFKRSAEIYFEGRVHEQIDVSLNKSNYSIVDSNIEVIHLGYDQSEEIYKQKALRNLELLIKEYKINSSSYNAFQIGQTYFALGKMEEGIPYFKDALTDINLEDNYKMQTYRFLAAFYCDNNDLVKAVEYVKNGLTINPDHHLLNIILSEIFLKQGNNSKSSEYFLKGYFSNKKLMKEDAHTLIDYVIQSDIIILRGMQLVLFNGDRNLLSVMKNEAKKYITDSEFYIFLQFVDYLLDNSLSNEFELSQINLLKYMNFEMISNWLNQIDNKKEKENILGQLSFSFNDNLNFNSYCAEFFFMINVYDKAAFYYEKVYSTEKNLEVFLKLITLYFNLHKSEKIIELISEGEILFANHPNVLTQLEIIKLKLNEN